MGWKKSIDEQLKKHDAVEKKAKEAAKKREKKEEEQSAYPAVGCSYVNTEESGEELIDLGNELTCTHLHVIPYSYEFYRGTDIVPMSNSTKMILTAMLCIDCYSVIKVATDY